MEIIRQETIKHNGKATDNIMLYKFRGYYYIVWNYIVEHPTCDSLTKRKDVIDSYNANKYTLEDMQKEMDRRVLILS